MSIEKNESNKSRRCFDKNPGNYDGTAGSENMKYDDYNFNESKQDERLFDKRQENIDDYPFDESFNVASATECTGLMPFAPEWESEITSYSDIYDVPLPKIIADGNSTE